MGPCSISTISSWSINGTWPEGLLASIISSGSLRFWCSSHLSMAPSMKVKCLKKRATPRKCPPVGSSVVGANSLVLPAIVILFFNPVIKVPRPLRSGYPFASLSPCQWTSLKVSPIMNRIGWWRFILRCICYHLRKARSKASFVPLFICVILLWLLTVTGQQLQVVTRINQALWSVYIQPVSFYIMNETKGAPTPLCGINFYHLWKHPCCQKVLVAGYNQ